MNIIVQPKGFLKKHIEGATEVMMKVDAGTTAETLVKSMGIDIEDKRFGFVAINGHRVMIDTVLKEGDSLKIYPRISGG